jgi:flagellar basal-body rod protein FlgB
MHTDLSVLRIAGLLGRHAAARHSMIAANIANADTPGYRAADIESFSEALRRRRDGVAAPKFQSKSVETLGSASPNGNTVSLEDQLLRASEAVRAGEIAATIFSKAISILRAAGARPR